MRRSRRTLLLGALAATAVTAAAALAAAEPDRAARIDRSQGFQARGGLTVKFATR